jgi:hypothetical protein
MKHKYYWHISCCNKDDICGYEYNESKAIQRLLYELSCIKNCNDVRSASIQMDDKPFIFVNVKSMTVQRVTHGYSCTQ